MKREETLGDNFTHFSTEPICRKCAISLAILLVVSVAVNWRAKSAFDKESEGLKARTTSSRTWKNRSYRLKKEWGFTYVRFEDVDDDGELDQVLHIKEYDDYDDSLVPRPDEVSDPSSEDWIAWELRFKRIR